MTKSNLSWSDLIFMESTDSISDHETQNGYTTFSCLWTDFPEEINVQGTMFSYGFFLRVVKSLDHVAMAKIFNTCQPVRTAWAYMGLYLLQIH